MEYIFESCLNKDMLSYKSRLNILKLYKKYLDFKLGFTTGVKNFEHITMHNFRIHMGSTMSIIFAFINLINIRQVILKYSINFIKSKNIYLIKLFQIPFFISFYILLFIIWQIPSLSVQFGLHWLISLSSGIQTLLIPNEVMYNKINSQEFISEIINYN